MAKANLTVRRGTTQPFTYTHPEAMTGGTIYFTVKPAEFDADADDSDALIFKTITTFTSGDTVASWELSDSDLQIEPDTYYYDVVYEAADGKTIPPIVEGKFKVVGKVTNRNV